ncbi:MAG TPA: folate-binding protein [Gammaproteobacteria bacterium]
MNTNWLNWLGTRGAVIENAQVLHFDDPAQEPAATVQASIITDLSHYGLLQVDGADATQFLQNQTGNDVRKVDAHYSQLSSYCSPKGRMYAVFRLFRIEDRYLLRMPTEVAVPLQKRLQLFVLMSKVKLSAVGDSWVRFGIAGPDAATVLKKELGTNLENPNAVAHTNGFSVIRVPGKLRFEIYGPLQAMQSLWQACTPKLTPVGRDAWPLLDILNGIPTVYAQTSEHFVPQMANLQLIDGVNFKKGCYPGQEVVARMQYLGKLKRRMYCFEINTPTAPEPGTVITALLDGTAHETGEIVDARPVSAGNCMALAIVQSSNIGQPLRLQDAAGPALELKPLPYPVATLDET